MRHLGVLVEWVHQHQVDSILLEVSHKVSFTRRQESEVWATLNSQTFRIKSKILKLIELEETEEFLIRL